MNIEMRKPTGEFEGEVEVSEDGTRVSVLSGTEEFRTLMSRFASGFHGPRSTFNGKEWAAVDYPIPPGDHCFRSCVLGFMNAVGLETVFKS